MKLIKSLACLLLVSAVKISAAAFEETNFDNSSSTNSAAEETNFANLSNANSAAVQGLVQTFLENSAVEQNTLGMTSTVDYPLTSAEVAALSITGLFSIVTDDTIMNQLRNVFGVLNQDSAAGINVLSAIEFTPENVTDLEQANSIKQSVAALLAFEGSALRDSTAIASWGFSSDETIVPEGDTGTTTILSLNYFQKSIIQLAREESTIGLSHDSFLSTLTLLTYGADEALSILESHIAIGAANLESPTSAVKLELLNALRQEVQRLETANVSASMVGSSFTDHATSSYQPVGLISVRDSQEAEEGDSSVEENIGRDRLASVDRTDELATREYGEDL